MRSRLQACGHLITDQRAARLAVLAGRVLGYRWCRIRTRPTVNRVGTCGPCSSEGYRTRAAATTGHHRTSLVAHHCTLARFGNFHRMIFDHLGALPECLELGSASGSKLIVRLVTIVTDARIICVNVWRAVALDMLQERHRARRTLRKLLLSFSTLASVTLRSENTALKCG